MVEPWCLGIAVDSSEDDPGWSDGGVKLSVSSLNNAGGHATEEVRYIHDMGSCTASELSQYQRGELHHARGGNADGELPITLDISLIKKREPHIEPHPEPDHGTRGAKL